MTAIAPGVRVKCIKDTWRRNEPLPPIYPTKGTIWIVRNTRSDWEGDWIALVGVGGWWNPRCFVPLDGDTELTRLADLAARPTNPDQPAKRHEILEPASFFLPDAETCLWPSVTEAEGVSYPHSALANSCRSDALAPGHTAPIVGPARQLVGDGAGDLPLAESLDMRSRVQRRDAESSAVTMLWAREPSGPGVNRATAKPRKPDSRPVCPDAKETTSIERRGDLLPPSPRVPLSPVSRWRTGQTRSDPEGRAGLADARVKRRGQSEKPAPFLMNESASS